MRPSGPTQVCSAVDVTCSSPFPLMSWVGGRPQLLLQLRHYTAWIFCNRLRFLPFTPYFHKHSKYLEISVSSGGIQRKFGGGAQDPHL